MNSGRASGETGTAMKSRSPRHAFRYWTSRLALAAMLALVVMPAAGRLYASNVGGTSTSAPLDVGDRHGHVEPGAADPALPSDPVPRHAGHGDCPYCPLLGELVGTARPRPRIAAAPAGPVAPPAACAGHAWGRPHGPSARGPPASA